MALLYSSAAQCDCRGGKPAEPPLPGAPGGRAGTRSIPGWGSVVRELALRPRCPETLRRSSLLHGCAEGEIRGGRTRRSLPPSRFSTLRGFGAAPALAAPQPRRRFQHHSHVDAPPSPCPSAGNLGGKYGEVDGLMDFGTHTPALQQHSRCTGGEGDAAVQGAGRGSGEVPQGAARWGLIRAGRAVG